jgi:hypothetical protein
MLVSSKIKRRITMKYDKPEVFILDSSIKAIQGSTHKNAMGFTDNYPTEAGWPTTVSASAYEADE